MTEDTTPQLVDFQFFLQKFPVLPLPLILRADTYEELSAELDPLPTVILEQYIMDEEDEDDGLTEYIACGRLPAHEKYEAIVYWKAGLLRYEYVLKTYTKNGFAVIDSQIISGTVITGETMVESVATIQEDRIIYVAYGASNVNTLEFDTDKNKVQHYEINEDGTIIVT